MDIVLPVYNEEDCLKDSVLKVLKILSEPFAQGLEIRIVISDNRSTDRTAEIGQELEEMFDNVSYLFVDKKGVGAAVKAAWKSSLADYVGFMDVDLSTNVKHLKTTLEVLKSDPNKLVFGSRHLSESKIIGRSWLREVISRTYNFVLRLSFNIEFKDASCGFKFLSKEVFEKISTVGLKDDGWFFEPELLIKAGWVGIELHELPVEWTDDPNSKVNLISTIWNDLKQIVRLRKERRKLD